MTPSLDVTGAAWSVGYEGKGIGVVVIDSGVYKYDTYLRIGSKTGA